MRAGERRKDYEIRERYRFELETKDLFKLRFYETEGENGDL